MIKLEDMIQAVDSSVRKILIKGNCMANNRIFDENNIDNLTEQFKKDRVTYFDIYTNQYGEKVLVVKLVHWG